MKLFKYAATANMQDFEMSIVAWQGHLPTFECPRGRPMA